MVQGGAGADGEVRQIGGAQAACQQRGRRVRDPGHQVEHRPVDQGKHQHRNGAPGYGALQAQDSPVVEALVGVVPPELSKQAQHQPAGDVLKEGGQQRAGKIEEHIVVGDGAEHGVAEHGAKPVDNAQRQMDKAAVLPAARLSADHQALHDPAAEAVDKKGIHHVGAAVGALIEGETKGEHVIPHSFPDTRGIASIPAFSRQRNRDFAALPERAVRLGGGKR